MPIAQGGLGFGQVNIPSLAELQATGAATKQGGSWLIPTATGNKWYTPFMNQTRTDTSVTNPDGTYGMQDFYQLYGNPNGGNGQWDGANFAQVDSSNPLMRFNLPGQSESGNPWSGFGYVSDTKPAEATHAAKPSNDFIADTLLPGIAMAGFGAGLGGAFGGFGPFSDSGFFGNMAGGGDLLGAGSDLANIGGGGSDMAYDGVFPGGTETGIPTGTWGQWDPSSVAEYGTTAAGNGGISNTTLAKFWENLGISPEVGSVIGKVAPSILGIFGSNAQTNALSDVAKQNAALQQSAIGMGAPYRAEALEMLRNPASYYSSQEAQDNLAGTLQGLSVNGNPFGNATSLALAGQSQRGGYDRRLSLLGQMGGLANFNAAGANNAAQTQLALQQAMSVPNIWNAAGAGLNAVFNPQPSILDILKELKGIGGTSLA